MDTDLRRGSQIRCLARATAGSAASPGQAASSGSRPGWLGAPAAAPAMCIRRAPRTAPLPSTAMLTLEVTPDDGLGQESGERRHHRRRVGVNGEACALGQGPGRGADGVPNNAHPRPVRRKRSGESQAGCIGVESWRSWRHTGSRARPRQQAHGGARLRQQACGTRSRPAPDTTPVVDSSRSAGSVQFRFRIRHSPCCNVP